MIDITKIIMTFVFCVLGIGAFIWLLATEPKEPQQKKESDSCEKVTYGDFGPRLCGYNIDMICKNRSGWSPVSPEEQVVCDKYFKIIGLSNQYNNKE